MNLRAWLALPAGWLARADLFPARRQILRTSCAKRFLARDLDTLRDVAERKWHH